MAFACLSASAANDAATAKLAEQKRYQAAVLVPKSEGIARKIYTDVVNGIQDEKRLDIRIIEIDKNTSAASIETRINSEPTELLIAIGNTSYKLSKQVQTDAVKIAGGISGAPNGIPTVSLTADPGQTFRTLKQVSPDITTLRLIYHDEINGWWYQRAREVASEFGLQIIGYAAGDIKQGVQLYERLLKEADRDTTAVWIPLRGIVPSKTILPLLLEKAWSKKLSVISNNPSHTKLGGLLALYPEHRSMGRQIADFAIRHVENAEYAPLIEGVTAVKTAVNLRTSSHLGLRFNRSDTSDFDRVYPVQR